MTIFLATHSKLTLSAFIAAFAFLSMAGNVTAVSLYWTNLDKTPVMSASVKTCLSFASTAMSGAGMQNMRVSSMEVAAMTAARFEFINVGQTLWKRLTA